MLKSLTIISLVVLWAGAVAAQGSGVVRVSGVVRDEAGAPVAGAEVWLGAEEGGARRAVTGADGRFDFENVGARAGHVTARARGFATRVQSWAADGAGAAEFAVVLSASPLSEQLTVTATRTEARVGETAASVRVLSAATLAATAALTLDDALRQVPGFQLFRRTGSRAANPTAQGVSLRGVGASGASRALVLADGVPLNDPFGGWVAWGRVPRAAVARVEVLRGGASHLYGSAALGGVVHILTRPIEEGPALIFEASAGSLRTSDATLYAAARRGRWGASLAVEGFHTAGYHLVARDERGAADAPAAARYAALVVAVERGFGAGARAFLRGSTFGEARANGTRLQRNRTHLRQAVAGLDFEGARPGSFSLRAHASTQVFDQNFTAVAADRGSETLTREQRVPAQVVGFLAQWSRAFGLRQTFVAGAEAREARGASDELVYVAGRPASLVGAGGRERALGLFAEDVIRLSTNLLVTAGARLDCWRHTDALSVASPASGHGPSAVTVFPDRAESAFSPRASLLYHAPRGLSFSAAGYRAFRAPTLNELYRAFRVGNVLTLANENLLAERLTGAEGGAAYASPRGRVTARATLFWLEVTGPVANVTLSETPALITRRRQNLGRTRSRGIEVEADARPGTRWALSAGYQLTGARVVRFPADSALEGLRLPQVPRHSFTFRADYRGARGLTFGVQGRAAGRQFDDDLNRLPLSRFFTLDALAARRLGEGLELFAAAENLTGRRYEVGRTPLRTLGPPFSFRLGLRLRLGPR